MGGGSNVSLPLCHVHRKMRSHFKTSLLFATPWTVARQAPMSMGFPRQECWRGLPFPSPGDLPQTGIQDAPPALAGRLPSHPRDDQKPTSPHFALCDPWVGLGFPFPPTPSRGHCCSGQQSLTHCSPHRGDLSPRILCLLHPP